MKHYKLWHDIHLKCNKYDITQPGECGNDFIILDSYCIGFRCNIYLFVIFSFSTQSTLSNISNQIK